MKKLISIFCLLAILCAALAGCGREDEPSGKMTANILTISGPTGMGIAQMMQANSDGTTKVDYSFRVTANPSDILTAIVSGETDIAACPINLASTIWNKTNGQIQMLAVNTLGVLYIVTNGEEISSFEDLNGKTVVASGEGAIPDYAMRYLCGYYNVKPDIQFVDTFANASAMLASGEVQIALLAEPSVSSALIKNPELKVALDIEEIWSKMKREDGSAVSGLVQGCVIVRKEFADAHPDTVKEFLKEYQASVQFVTKPENADQAALYCEAFEILPKAAIAKKALPNSNIVFITGDEMKKCVSEELQHFYDFSPTSVGGKLPEGAFYYGAKN